MRLQSALLLGMLSLFVNEALAYVPAVTPFGATRHWPSGTVSLQFTGPTMVDGHAVHDGVRSAMASWNAIAHARIALTAGTVIDRREPAIGNGANEFGWVESSDSPYFIPGVPCTTAVIYDTLTGVVLEADTTCNAMAFQWPDNLFGLYTQEGVADAESAALAALGSWLGLDASLQYGDPMFPEPGPGSVVRALSADQFAFGRHQYADSTSPHGAVSGTVRFADGTPIPYAYVSATTGGDRQVYGAVANANGEYTIFEMMAGTYVIVARPLTTDPYILSSVPYRANPIRNLDFTPEYYGGGLRVTAVDGSVTAGIDITARRSGSQPDPYEPNEWAGSAAPLTPGLSKLATSHAPFDTDWYWFQSAANTCYIVASAFHGASIVPTQTGSAFWSRTRLALYDGSNLVGQNESKDEYSLDPANWLTYCETGAGRRLDVELEQREPGGGAGFFYTVYVQTVAGGSAVAPDVAGLYPNSGWSNRNRFVWIDGTGFLPGAKVDLRLPGGSWVPASHVAATRCDSTYSCRALKALFPTATPGLADVRVTNPNGRSVTRSAAFTYLASGYGPIEDRTPQAFGTRYGEGKAVCVADYDGDGSDDILKTRYGFLPTQLFRSNRNGTFADVAVSSGLHSPSSVFGASCSFIDVDDDGDLDAYITNVAYSLPSGSANELYANQLADDGGASFALATPAGLGGVAARFKSDAAWADFNNDGRLDVVLAYDSYAGSAPYGDALQYFRQQGNGSFADVTSSSGLPGYVASVTTVKAADFDNDGCEDLVCFARGNLANRLYKGNCHGYFTDVTSSSHLAEGSGWCAGVAVADFNGDGKADILCGTYNTGTVPARPRLWLNNGSAGFTDRAFEAGLYGIARNMDVVLAFDQDNDGFTDIYVGASESGAVNDRKDALLRNTGGNPPVFVDITEAAAMYPTTQDGTGYCGAGVDEFFCDRDAAAGAAFDDGNDGALDVFVTGSDPDSLQRGSDFFWRNRGNTVIDGSTAPANDWIEVALKGANTRGSRVLSNRFGIGARVTVIPSFNLPAGDLPTETQCLQNPLPAGVTGATKEVLAGNQSQAPTVLHFGLGSSLPFGRKRIDCIRVSWPSGLERAYTGITANTRVVLAEDSGRMKVISVVPNSGPNTRSDPTTIAGLRFDRDVLAVPQVFFGAVPAAAVTFVSEHELTVLPPMWQPPGTVDVTVVNTDGARDTLLSAYTYTGSNTGVHFKDPVPSMLTLDGVVSSSPGFVAARGIERTGIIADGVTQLVLEAEVGGPGQVRFTLDDNGDPGDTPPTGTGVGTIRPLGGGVPQTTHTVPVTALADGRYVAHAVYTAPQDFIRTAADAALATRPIEVRASFIDAANVERAMPERVLTLYRVPVLYVHGMWGSPESFEWPILSDARWIIHRADYSASHDVSFSENAGMPPRVIAELRKKLNDRGIAGTRFFVFAHSMGAVLFKIYMGGAGVPYARADNFFAGDVYALVSVDAPFFGSYFASLVSAVRSTVAIGPVFTSAMRSLGLDVDRGCMESLDPSGRDILGIPAASGTFHAIVGWGGGEMRSAGVDFATANKLALVKMVLSFFDFGFETGFVQCGSGDDFIVCTDSQRGGLAGSYVSNFHFESLSVRAIHLDSICNESAPSATAERLLNTPTTQVSEWGYVLPPAPPPSTARPITPPKAPDPGASVAASESDGVVLALAKQGGDVALTWTGPATRLLRSFSASLEAGACLAVSGNTAIDAHQLSTPANVYYAAGEASLCPPAGAFSVASISPASGSTMGGYTVTVLGTGFDATVGVKIGNFNASQVVVVNATTLTCRVPPGNPGATAVIVTNGAGQIANATFTYSSPGPVPGGVAITAPSDGTAVAMGSTIAVSAVGSGGFTIAGALVLNPAFSAGVDQDPGEGFTTNVTVPAEWIGPLVIELIAKDGNGNFRTAAPVTIDVLAPGNVSLSRLDAEKLTMLHASPSRQLRVFGIYSDGVRRELTHAPGILYEMDTQDPRKPNYPFNGTGVAVVDSAGMVTAKTQGATVCHVTYSARKLDVVVEVAGIRPTVTLQKPGFVSWPFQGAGITYDLVRGKLSGLRATRGNYADPSLGTVCSKDDFLNVTAADTATPPVGDGFFYLMRDSTTSSYEESPFWPTGSQAGQRTAEINAAPGHCP